MVGVYEHGETDEVLIIGEIEGLAKAVKRQNASEVSFARHVSPFSLLPSFPTLSPAQSSPNSPKRCGVPDSRSILQPPN